MISLVGLIIAFFCLPVVEPGGPMSKILVDREGRLLSAQVADDEQWRLPPRHSLPTRYVRALLTFEDHRFWYHVGIDPLAVIRAVVANVRNGRVMSGASTITMQVIRMGRDAPQRTIVQKAWEALLALRLEAAHSKAQILSTYANNAPFGGNVVGLEAAAWRYFGRPSSSLTWAEAALLAVLPNSPGLMHPGRGRQKLKAKRDRLLERLAKEGAFSKVDLKLARAEPLPLRPTPMPQLAIHWLPFARTQKSAWEPTTIDQRLQRQAEIEVKKQLAALRGDGVHNAGAIVLHIPTSEVRAYVGNGAGLQDLQHAPYVDVVRAPRSTGSVLKPLLYAYALDAGELNPAERLADAPLRIGTYYPENFDGTFRGLVRADKALALSLNVPAVLLLKRVGVSRFLAFLQRTGLSTLDRSARNYGLSLVLGGAEASLWELTAIYAGLAWRASGHKEAWPKLQTGLAMSSPDIQLETSIGAAYLTFDALQEVRRPGLRSRWRDFANARSIYWKTGTSFGFRDAWSIGVTQDYAVGVWVGNADGEGRPGLVGLRAAAPIMFALFDQLPASPAFVEPEGAVKTIEVCKHSGRRPGPHCAHRSLVGIPSTTSFEAMCTFCRSFTCDEDCRHRVHAQCHPFKDIQASQRFVLPPFLERYYRQHSLDYESLPPWKEGCAREHEEQKAMSCIFPPPNGKFFVPKELSGERGRLVFEAAHRNPKAAIHWHLDNGFIATTRAPHQLEVDPGPGAHILTLVDEHGEQIQRNFRVIAGHTSEPSAGAID
ncbi:MAG: penicillin-binding protein 1C [Myxococcota bacterium]